MVTHASAALEPLTDESLFKGGLYDWVRPRMVEPKPDDQAEADRKQDRKHSAVPKVAFHSWVTGHSSVSLYRSSTQRVAAHVKVQGCHLHQPIGWSAAYEKVAEKPAKIAEN